MKKHSLKFILGLVITLFFSIGFSNAQSSENSIGQYWSPKKDAKIKVYKQGDNYFGQIIWTKQPVKDTKNPKPELRTRDVVSLVFLTNFIYKDKEYINGQVYDSESGKTYSCKMWLENGNLKVKGYIGLSLFGRSETFIKIK
jgi:uncharacterized protein (DUF2147 family)